MTSTPCIWAGTCTWATATSGASSHQGCHGPSHFFPCSSATSIFIASLTGMWATPASRSTQP